MQPAGSTILALLRHPNLWLNVDPAAAEPKAASKHTRIIFAAYVTTKIAITEALTAPAVSK